MRKSEGKLSATQDEKVEKELAILVQAMNKYRSKEN